MGLIHHVNNRVSTESILVICIDYSPNSVINTSEVAYSSIRLLVTFVLLLVEPKCPKSKAYKALFLLRNTSRIVVADHPDAQVGRHAAVKGS